MEGKTTDLWEKEKEQTESFVQSIQDLPSVSYSKDNPMQTPGQGTTWIFIRKTEEFLQVEIIPHSLL